MTSVERCFFASRHSSSRKTAATKIAPSTTLVHRHGQKGVVDGVVLVAVGGQAAQQRERRAPSTLCQISKRPDNAMLNSSNAIRS